MLRRVKADVFRDIPEKKERIVPVSLTELQRRVYKDVLLRNTSALLARRANMSSLTNIIAELRKVCNHPFLFPAIREDFEDADPSDSGQFQQSLVFASGKMVLLDRMLRRLREDGHRVLVFSQFTRVLDLIEEMLEFREYSFTRLDGSTSAETRQQRINEYNRPGAWA
jgi:SNF2 family DNA or RNA helicase